MHDGVDPRVHLFRPRDRGFEQGDRLFVAYNFFNGSGGGFEGSQLMPLLGTLFLLFLVPAGRDGEPLLTWKDDGRQVPWDAMLMCTGAVAMVDALTKFGFIDFVADELPRNMVEADATIKARALGGEAGLVQGAGLGSAGLVYLAAFVVAWSTDMMSGTAAVTLFGSIFVPAAQATGHNPASMAMLVANVALGLTFPWAGAAAATAFSVGDVEIKRMISIGIPATIVFASITATLHLLLGPFV